MSTVASNEARELQLVGKVELRIALAKDEKLESILKLYLPPLLLKLCSDHVTVRNKVLSVDLLQMFPSSFIYRSSQYVSTLRSGLAAIGEF
jgi:hypothetical protein